MKRALSKSKHYWTLRAGGSDRSVGWEPVHHRSEESVKCPSSREWEGLGWVALASAVDSRFPCLHLSQSPKVPEIRWLLPSHVKDKQHSCRTSRRLGVLR